MSKQIVVNFLGEPSCGKSTAAAYVFSKLKMSGISCEYISEFAKDKVYEENKTVFDHQEYIFGKQSFKMDRVAGKVDVIITDSPLILSALYNTDKTLGEHFNDVVLHKFNSYENYTYLLKRQHGYENGGRLQNEQQAEELRNDLVRMLSKYNIKYQQVNSNIVSYDMIVEFIKERVKSEQ